MGWLDDARAYGEKKKDEAVDLGGDLWSGLTDKTGDVIQSGESFANDAATNFNEYVADPILGEVQDAQEWSHNAQEDAADALAWGQKKAAEGYVESTDYFFGDGGIFESVREKVEQGWEAGEDGNYIEAAKQTGRAFIDAVDEIATGGLGETGLNWILDSVNEGAGSGELRYEIRGDLIKIDYLDQTVVFKADNIDQIENFVGQLGALAEGSEETDDDWATVAAAVEAPAGNTEAAAKEQAGQGMTGGNGGATTAKDYSKIRTGTDSAGRGYIIGGL